MSESAHCDRAPEKMSAQNLPREALASGWSWFTEVGKVPYSRCIGWLDEVMNDLVMIRDVHPCG
jgi:hypothetical protein